MVNVGVSCPGGCVHTLTGHQSLTSGMELRDNVLVSGNADSTVRVWDIRTGQCLHMLQGETARSWGVRWSDASHRLSCRSQQAPVGRHLSAVLQGSGSVQL